jgi:acid phosphatase (class A)
MRAEHGLRWGSLAFAFALATGVFAEPLHFLAASAVDPVKLLPAPPSADSAETRAELDLILRLQEARSSQEVLRVRSDAGFDLSAFAPVMGAWFTPTNLPSMNKFLKDVDADSRGVCARARAYFGRKRPMFLDRRVQVAIPGQEDACYPSGHATRGVLVARILSELAPGKREALLERGRELGWSRVVGGVHYPSDLGAGRGLGQALADAMFANPDFRRELVAVKSEFDEASKRLGESTGAR